MGQVPHEVVDLEVDLVVDLVAERAVVPVVVVAPPLLQVDVLVEAQLAVEAYHSCCCRTTPDGQVIRCIVKSPTMPMTCFHRHRIFIFYK